MKYPLLKEKDNPFVFDGRSIDDPYQWIRDNKNGEVLAWVKEENELTESFFVEHKDLYEYYLAKNKSKPSFPALSSISKYKDGYVATNHEHGDYNIVITDKNFNVIGDFKDVFATFERTNFYAASACPADPDIIAFHGQIFGTDRPSIFLWNLTENRLIRQFDGIFTYTFAKDKKTLIFGDAKADVANKITYNYLRAYHIDTDELETIYAYDKNAIMADGFECGDDYAVCVEVDYSNNILLFKENGEFKQYTDEPALTYYAGEKDGKHIILSYINKVEGQVIARDNKDEVIFEKDNFFIKSVIANDNKVYVLGTEDVSAKAYVISDKTEEIELPEECSIEVLNSSDPIKDNILVKIESFVLPPTVYKINGNKCEAITHNELDYDLNDVIVEKKFYPSVDDGTMIPAYLIRMKDTPVDGNMPTLMYGYGGYNLAMPPSYSNPFIGLNVMDWVKEGGLYVNCNIRGGNEYGEDWHLQGYKLKKKNCYYDFIGVAEGIIRDGYTNPKKMAINGGSNGGLLVTALLTMRPDLWGCCVGSVPHTDMISFVNDDRGPMYITEYGDPHDEEQFNYFLTYSPFHNIRKVNYPPTYIQTGECDNNVPPYHGKKFAARLQQYNTSDNPVLLRVLATGSHDRGSGEEYYKTVSEMQTFLHLALNLKGGK